MMILEHGDMGCGIAMMFHMPSRGYKKNRNGNSPWDSSRERESLDEYKERFLSSTLKQRRMFTSHSTSTMCTEDFSAVGNMKDGTKILKLRTAYEWLFEYHLRPATLITLGEAQNNTQELGKVLLDVGFKLVNSYKNPIMGWSPVFMYVYPEISIDEKLEKAEAWRNKLKLEEEAMIAAGIGSKELNVSTYTHEGL